MTVNDAVYDGGPDRLDLAKKCLQLISDIAGRGARSQNPSDVCYALQELTQLLIERTGTEEILFEPVPIDQITGLERLLEELDLVDSCAQSMAASAQT
jgi:hypothetical protein